MGKLNQKPNWRGVIEKKRRDKINNILLELKSLVPHAVRKEPWEKLEKAEILNLTVEYLKSLKKNSSTRPPVEEILDFREMGFNNCLFEISNYLLNEEGLDYQDPFRLRLMSYLSFNSNQDVLVSNSCETFYARILKSLGF